MRLHGRLVFALLAFALTACAAPQSPQQTLASTDSEAPADAMAPAPGTPDLRKLKVRTGGPLPPQVLPEPVKLDYHCTSAADCAVKDIGNCCGAYPACVNKDSPTDPAAVQAQCAKQGRVAACGFQPIDACSCTQGQCTPRGDTSQSKVR
jgi:hypothetical protein